jgi:two-component system nitrogen regulation response regulator NtrX
MSKKILILEDNEKLGKYYTKLLKGEDFEVVHVKNSTDFFVKYPEFNPSIIILDIKLNNSKLSGLEVFEKLVQKGQGDAKVIVLSGEATRSEIAHAMKLGAHTFIEKTGDFNVDKFLSDVKTAYLLKEQEDANKELLEEKRNLTSSFLAQYPLIGESRKIKALRSEILRFANADADILICGDTGTGKEVVAHHLYWHSKRSGKPFVKVNAGGMPDGLVDSELFGHKKGSFTDASYNKEGYFEQADGGYLFLDEIASISPAIQAKILRAIENKEIRVVGGEQKKVDVKLIFASNKDLKQLIKDDEFRSDLYYRVARNVIFVPPLIQRESDIILLMNYFCEKHSKEFKAFLDFDLNKIKGELLRYPWPGNVRELSSFCENLLIRYNIIDNDVILEEISNKISGKFYKDDESLFKLLQVGKLSDAVNTFENKYLQYHIARNDGNMSKTADEIGIERTTLYRKLKKGNEESDS